MKGNGEVPAFYNRISAIQNDGGSTKQSSGSHCIDYPVTFESMQQEVPYLKKFIQLGAMVSSP